MDGREEDQPRFQGSDNDVFERANCTVYDQGAGEEMAAKIAELKNIWYQLVGNTTEPDAFGNVLIAEIDFAAIDKFIKAEL